MNKYIKLLKLSKPIESLFHCKYVLQIKELIELFDEHFSHVYLNAKDYVAFNLLNGCAVGIIEGTVKLSEL
jgi:hypothetical protein